MRKALMAVLLFLSGAAFGQGADVGLVNMVSGEVALAPHEGVDLQERRADERRQ